MQKSVLIAIQARSGSTRLPRKSFELISGKMMLDRVIESCKKAALYLNRTRSGTYKTKVAVLTPFGDPISKEFEDRCDIVEGPEHDVLTRYRMAIERYNPDFIVRITADCPMLPPFVISKLVTLAHVNEYDYVSNVDERFRTALDGVDCEVISSRLLYEVAETAEDPAYREHVTLMIRKEPPDWAKVGVVVNYFDQSDIKLSVDTQDDLIRVRRAFDQANRKYNDAVLAYGNTAVHRI